MSAAVQTALADAALPTLPAALDRDVAGPALRAAVPAVRALHAVRLVRHKPGRRAVLEYDVDLDGAPATLVAKIRRRRTGAGAFALGRELAAAGVSVPEPVGEVESLRLWLQRKVPGAGLTDLVGGAPDHALMSRVAGACRTVHAAGVAPRVSHAMADELRILHERLPAVTLARPEMDARIARLLVACDRLGVTVSAPDACGIHRDFYADQVVVDGERIWLLDFDLYCLGDPAVDAGNLLAHLTEQALREHDDPAALAENEAAFADAFLASAGAGSRARSAIAAYKTLTLARHVHLSTVLPGRTHLTGALLELCEERLGLAPRSAR